MIGEKPLSQVLRDNAVAMNFHAAMAGKGPKFDVAQFDLSPASANTPRKPKSGPEAGVLHAVLQALALHPAVAWVRRMNTGAIKVGAGKSARFICFGFPGCSDVLGQMKDGRLLAIECKSATGRLSDEQKNFIETVRASGGVAGMARNVDEALLIIKYGLMQSNDAHQANDQSGQGAGRTRAALSGPRTPRPYSSPDAASDSPSCTITSAP